MIQKKQPARSVKKYAKAKSHEKLNWCRLTKAPTTNPENGSLQNIRLQAPGLQNARSFFLRLRFGFGFDFCQLRAVFRRHIRFGGVLTALQGAEVGDYRPTIGDRNVRPVRQHRVLAVGDRVEDFAIGHLANPLVLQTNDGREAVLLCASISVCRHSMTNSAIDIETLSPPLQQIARHRPRQAGSPVRTHLASVVIIGPSAKSQARSRSRVRL